MQKEVYLTQYQEAAEKAKISKVEKTGDKEIQIYYNQSMTGADEPEHFRILFQGERPAEVLKAEYTEKDGDYYSTLQLKDSIYQGDYTIGCSDVVSNSMEKTEPEEFTAELKGKNYILRRYGPPVLFAAAAAGCAASGRSIRTWRGPCGSSASSPSAAPPCAAGWSGGAPCWTCWPGNPWKY